MKEDLIFSNLTELKTPVGIITVECLGERIHFDVVSGIFSSSYGIYAADNKTLVDRIFTDANYQICIAISDLKVGMNYTLKFHGGTLHYNAGDEHTISLTGTFGEYSLGLGAYDPNDDEKVEQAYAYSKEKGYLERKFIMEPPQYDTDNFVQYSLKVLESMSGYYFKLLDRSFEYIYFPVAWIFVHTFDADTYESAIDFWIS